MNDAIEMGMLSGCSYVKQWNYLTTIPLGLLCDPCRLHRVCLRFPVSERGWRGMKDMFDGESATSQKNVEYFKYSETEGGSSFWCVIGDDSEHRVLHEQIRTLDWVKREKIENAANSETIYVVGAGQDVGVDDDVTMMDATVNGGIELDNGDGGDAGADD